MAAHEVCKVEDLPPGRFKVVSVGGRSIGVFNVQGTYYALRNTCPHQGASLCAGKLSGTMLPSDPQHYEYGMDQQVIRCPWHGWEFDVKTGGSLFDPDRWRVKTYPVRVEHGTVILEA